MSSPASAHAFQHGVKRGIDLFVSGLGLLVLSPLLIGIAVAVKASSPGPLFYVCNWVGKNGKRFDGYKFRTMVTDAAAMEEQLRARNEMQGPAFKITNDPRVTRLGRLIRPYSLDELPQLWSVFIGDLSLVGPRPPRIHEFARFTEYQKQKLAVKPGITCLWQVQGRHKISDYDDWVAKDLEYIRTWSLALDMKILLLTIPAVIRGTGI